MKRISDKAFIHVRHAMVMVSLVGLFASIYLLITYVSGKPIVCGTVAGCELVRASPQAKTVFNLPRPLLGVLFYVTIIGLLIARTYLHKHSKKWTNVILALTGIGFAESVWLTIVQAFQIRAYCTWCVTSAVAATALFVLAFFEGDGEPDARSVAKELQWIFYALLAAVLGGGLLMSNLLSNELRGELPKIVPTNMTTSAQQRLVPDGTPVMGPATSTVTVVEFLDIECSACRVFYPVLHKIQQEYGDRVRFAVRLFPLYELHTHANAAAVAANCAQRQGKFFEYSDAALLNQDNLERADLVRYASALSLDVKLFEACLDDKAIADHVAAERKAGEELGINSTPTLFVNDELVDGMPTYEQFKQILDEKLK